MNKWSLALLVLCISAVVCQEDESAEDQQYLGMRRTACLVLSRYHSNTQKDTIESVVQGLTPELQQQYINKIYSTAVETCEPLINQSEVQEVPFPLIILVVRWKPRLRSNSSLPSFRNRWLLSFGWYLGYPIDFKPTKHRQIHQAIRWRNGSQKRRKRSSKSCFRIGFRVKRYQNVRHFIPQTFRFHQILVRCSLFRPCWRCSFLGIPKTRYQRRKKEHQKEEITKERLILLIH